MAIPNDIDPQALQLFDEAGWEWDNKRKAFIEPRKPDQVSTSEYKSGTPRFISYEQLRDHDLSGDGPKPNRLHELEWLTRELGRNK
ncbi:MAG: hypothetical protein E8D40_03905 [Nitrospira sp.]|nr:MAG: hypothetical protein E8D40_03905 [Nitrospira sp.]